MSQEQSRLSKLLALNITVKQRIYFYLAFFGIRGVWLIIRRIINQAKHRKMLQKAAQYMEERGKRIGAMEVQDVNLLSEVIEKVLNSSVTELKEMLTNNEVSSCDLVNIFTSRCKSIALQMNIITEFDYENAIQAAKKCDESRKFDVRIVKNKPLFGIPVSVKDFLDMKGLPSTVGCISKLDNIPSSDGLIVKLIREAGGIPFVKTNVPQLGLSFESANHIYGRALNPWDTKRYPGGSSGGESACIAARCSPIGIGSDHGGSVRSPAAFTGLVGFKPTSGRAPIQGLTFYSPTSSGEQTMKTSIGPISKCVDDAVLMMKALLNVNAISQMKLSDSMMHQVVHEFKDRVYESKSKLRIGYFKSLEVFEASVANQRAVQIAADSLKSVGHDVIEIAIPKEDIDAIMFLYFELSVADNLANFTEQLKDEQLMDVYQPALNPFHLPHSLKKVISFFLKLFGDPLKAKLLVQMKKGITAEEYLRKIHAIMALRKKITKFLEDRGISAIVCPSFSTPALLHKSSAKVLVATGYLLIWNVLNFPAGVVPVTTVLESEQHYDAAQRLKTTQARFIHQNMLGTAGLPVGVQVVTLPNQDELCLNVMKQIEEQVAFYSTNKFPI